MWHCIKWLSSNKYSNASMKDTNDINYIHECASCKIKKPNFKYYKIPYKKGMKRLYRSRCNACLKKDSKEIYTVEKARNRHFKRNYKIDIEKYNELFNSQEGKCLVCLKQFKNNITYSGNRLVVDHSHETTKIRGLLCSQCNSGLGYFKENITSLYNAIEYLKSHQENTLVNKIKELIPL